MKMDLSRRVPVAVAMGLALAMLALGLLAALGVRSLVQGTASASPQVPNPGHEWSDIGLPAGTWTGLDADTLDGNHASELLPSGAILMWSGTLASIPSGWQLCDGTNGTPDLRGRFIYGVSAGEDPGAIGGSSTYSLTVSQLPAHTHTATMSYAGSHGHEIILGAATGSTLRPWAHYNLYSNVYSYYTQSAGIHRHTVTINPTGGGSSIDNRPDYYKLAFIMKL